MEWHEGMSKLSESINVTYAILSDDNVYFVCRCSGHNLILDRQNMGFYIGFLICESQYVKFCSPLLQVSQIVHDPEFPNQYYLVSN